jgi:mRNA interferase MazF
MILNPSDLNGLKKISLIRTAKIATLSIDLAKGLLGKLSPIELFELDQKLKILLQLT